MEQIIHRFLVDSHATDYLSHNLSTYCKNGKMQRRRWEAAIRLDLHRKRAKPRSKNRSDGPSHHQTGDNDPDLQLRPDKNSFRTSSCSSSRRRTCAAASRSIEESKKAIEWYNYEEIEVVGPPSQMAQLIADLSPLMLFFWKRLILSVA